MSSTRSREQQGYFRSVLFIAIAASWVLVACKDAPASPPGSLPATLTLETDALPTLEPIAQGEIVNETNRLAEEIGALNSDQAALLSLIEADSPVTLVASAQRRAVSRGISIGVTADLLANGIAREGGEVAAATQAMYEDMARAAYSSAYVLAIQPADGLLADREGARKGLGLVWSFLNTGAAPPADVGSALGSAQVNHTYEVTAQAAGEPLPDTVVSLSSDRFTLILEGLADSISGEGNVLDFLQPASDPYGNATLDDMKAAVAARLAFYAEPAPTVSTNQTVPEELAIRLPKQIVVSTGVDAGAGGRMYRVLAESNVPTELFSFFRDKLVPKDLREGISQRIEQAMIDMVFDPQKGPDVGLIIDLLSGKGGNGSPRPKTLEFDAFLDGALAQVPSFSADGVDVGGTKNFPKVYVQIRFSGLPTRMKLGCGIGRDGYTHEVGPGDGIATFDLNVIYRSDDRLAPIPETLQLVCGTVLGAFLSQTVRITELPAPTFPPESTPTRSPDTAPGTTLGDPAIAISGGTLTITVGYSNPSGATMELECYFNGPAFSGAGGYNRERKAVSAASGTATFTFDLGGTAQPGAYEATCVLNDDISRTGSLQHGEEPPAVDGDWGIYDLQRITEQTNSALGLVVERASEINDIPLCGYSGGGNNCEVTVGDYGGGTLVLGPYATEEEAVRAYCENKIPGTEFSGYFHRAEFSFDGQLHDIHNAPACE